MKLTKLLAVLVVLIGLSFTASTAWAVSGLEVTVRDGQDNLLPGSQIQLFNDQGQQVEEDDRDDRGAIWFWNNLEPGTYTVRKGGKVIRTVDVKDGAPTRISVVDNGGAPVGRSPNDNAVTRFFSGMDMALMLAGLWKRTSFDGDLNYVTGNQSTQDDLDVSGAGGAIDVMIKPHEFPFFFMLGAAILDGGVDKTGALSDFHPIAGIIDSSLTVEEKYYFRAMIGYTFWRAQQTEVDVVGGIQGTRVEATLRTDETGGGGVNNRFTESEMMYSPVLGAQARHNMPNTFNMFLYAGLYATHMDDLDITGTSAVNNFDYNARLGGGWQYEGRFGVGFPF